MKMQTCTIVMKQPEMPLGALEVTKSLQEIKVRGEKVYTLNQLVQFSKVKQYMSPGQN